MSFTGGKLKLKGQDGVKKKKKKRQSGEGAEGSEQALVPVQLADGEATTIVVGKETKDGFLLEPPPDGIDRRTAAEKRYDEMMAKREVEQSKKAAMKSHRERVNEFNTYLQNLSEHHDIPRVGPG